METNDLNFSYESTTGGRTAYRASLPGLVVHTDEGITLDVKDISAGGVGLVCPPGWVPPLETTLALYVSGKLYAEDLTSQLVQTGRQGIAAYTFVGLARQQELRLDKLVLAVQKHLIAMRKARKPEAES